MTLEGAKFICLDEAGNHGEIVLAKGRKFTMGYYVNCDYVLVDERAKGVHCEIESDAFGRVTIRNLSPDKPILVNGSPVEIKRILLSNSKLSILGKEYLWIFPKSVSNEFEDLPVQDTSTPQKLIGIPEQPPNSCPDFKLHRDLPKRFTVHNFAYCIQSDEEGNTSSESNNDDEHDHRESSKSKIDNEAEMQQAEQLMEKYSKKDDDGTSPEKDSDKEKENLYRCITPDANQQVIKNTTEPLQTPKMNLINCTKDKENSSTQKKNKQMLKMCHQSDIVITSFSPRETGVKICKSFATVVKPKVMVTKTPATPKSVYSTPKSDINEKDPDDVNHSDLIHFYTPSTSKKLPGNTSTTGQSAFSAKALKHSSMHLIDLTTPNKIRPASPHLRSNLKSSVKKNVSFNVEKSSKNLSPEEQFGLTALPATPVEANVGDCETTSSVISVNSSVENFSAIEVTSDGSNMAFTSSNVTSGLNTPLKAPTRPAVCTPKGTPQSLMKRAILTSAKKQTTNPTTPRREAINRIPLRNTIKTPTTPQVSTANASQISQLPRRQSMSTPIRKNLSQRRFDLSPCTSNTVSDSPSTSAETFLRRSSLNPISAAKALPTSTPVSGRSVMINRVASLHKVRKSLGGIPLSSHISKTRKSVILSASVSKITSLREKSPQQVMKDRLVNRARKSLGAAGNASRFHNLVKTTSHSDIQKQKVSTNDDNESDNLSRTFILHTSREDENVAVKKDATFSPEKNSPDRKVDSPAIEIPVDAEEVIDLCNDNKENTNQTNSEENKITVESGHDEVKHSIDINEDKLKDETDNAATANRTKPVITEESFAEEINASLKTQTEAKKNKVAAEELGQNTAIRNANEHGNAAETGFGEESSLEASQALSHKMALKDESQSSARTDVTKNEFENVLVTKAENEAEPLAEQSVAAGKIEIAKVDAQNSNEYKPIVEDITLEGSLIERETKANEGNNKNKVLCKDINFADSQIEENAKSNEVKEENQTKIAIKESEDKEQVSACTKDNNEVFAHSQTMKQVNTDVANITLMTEESSSSAGIQEKANTFVVEVETGEKIFQSSPVDMELLFYTNQYAKNIEVNNESTMPTTTTENQSKEMQVLDASAVKIHQQHQQQQVIEPEQSAEVGQGNDQNQSSINYEDRIEENLEETNKLLEEIEDVLNKSDEFKQKHLNESEESSDKPLTEEFESEQFSQVDDQEIDELKSETEDRLQNSPQQADNEAEFSNYVFSGSKSTNEKPEKEIPAAEKLPFNISANQTATVNETIATNRELSTTVEAIADIEASEQHINLQNEAVDKVANTECNELSQELDINSKAIKVVTNKNVEMIAAVSTPRRSTRRASQSADVHDVHVELTLTPRRSTRRASISAAESAAAFTPAKRTSRRSSLSITASETPLTPKPITKRRLSISIEDETAQPSTSKLQQRAKTPRKQLELGMMIPEETDDIGNVIMEAEEESEQQQQQVSKFATDIDKETTCQKDLAEISKQNVVTEEGNFDCKIDQAQLADNMEKPSTRVRPDLEESSADNAKVDQEYSEESCPEQPVVQTENDYIVIDEKLSDTYQKDQEMTDTSKASISVQQAVDNNVISNPSLGDVQQSLGEDLTHPAIETVAISSDDDDNDDDGCSAKSTKKVKILADSPKTPLMTGVRELLKTPKPEHQTPRFAGIRNLVLTPKNAAENEAEEVEKLAALSHLVQTPKEYAGINRETPSSSMKGVKELLKTPKTLSTPHFKGMRELMKTPQMRGSPNTTGVKELLQTPMPQACEDIQQISNIEIAYTKTLPEDFACSTSQSEISFKDDKELLTKTPNRCSTPRHRRLRELMKTPKTVSNPRLGDIKELLDDSSTVEQKEQELEKFLRTPTAKNIMIPTMPASAVIEKSDDSIEISTEYDLNSTNEADSTNLEELFKNPVVTGFVEHTSESYGEEEANKGETLQDELNKSAEEAYDKLIGQESQIQTPIRKRYARKSFALQTPTCSSPFTAAEILSDLPKSDVEEWIEHLAEAEPPEMTECEDDEEEGNEQIVEVIEEVDRSTIAAGEISSINKQQNLSLNESIIPETCAKIFITEKSLQDTSTRSLTYADTKDPLLNTYTNVKEKQPFSPVTSIEAEISGINLLDQTMESVQDEPTILDEPLFVEEPSMFDEALIVSENESEGERTLNEVNELSEPLLVSDSEDFNQSQERDERNNKTGQTEMEETEAIADTNMQEKSMLEKTSNEINLLADDPLETEHMEASMLAAMAVAEEQISSTTQIGEIEKDPISDADINSTTLNIDAVVDAAETVSDDRTVCENPEKSPLENIESKEVAIEETKIVSTASENIFVDTSANEICEETNILNAESTEIKEKSKQEVCEEKTENECQNIFMDNSNIDESFADEAINEENNAALDITITKISAEENVNEMVAATTATSREVDVSSLAEKTQFEATTTTGTTNVMVDEKSVASDVKQVEPSPEEIAESQPIQTDDTSATTEKQEESAETVKLHTTLPNKNLKENVNTLETCAEVVDATTGDMPAQVVSEPSERYVVEQEMVCEKQTTEEETNASVKDDMKMEDDSKSSETEEQKPETNMMTDSEHKTTDNKLTITLDKEDTCNISKELAQTPVNTAKEIEVQSGTDFEQITEKVHITESQQSHKGLKENTEMSIDLPVRQISSNEERSVLEDPINTTTNIIKYDFEIEITEDKSSEEEQVLKANELATTSSQIECPPTSQVIQEIIPKADEQHHKMEINDDDDVKSCTESSQESISAEKMQKSSRPKATTKEEGLKDQDTISALLKGRRKRTTSESSHGSVNDQDVGCTRTRKGGRRRNQKPSQVPTVEEEQLQDNCKDINPTEINTENKEQTATAEIEKHLSNAFITTEEEEDNTGLTISMKHHRLDRVEEKETEKADKSTSELSTATLEEQQRVENIVENQTTLSEVSTVEKPEAQLLPGELSKETETAEQTVREETVETTVTETEQLPPKRLRSKTAVSETKEVLGESVVEETQTAEGDATASSHSAENIEDVVLDTEEIPPKRSRRNPTLSESSQDSQMDVGNAPSRKNRRQLKKTPLEETVPEESQEVLVTAIEQAADKINTKPEENTAAITQGECPISDASQTIEIVSEAKEISNTPDLPEHTERINEAPTVSLDAVEQTQKRTRRKIAILKNTEVSKLRTNKDEPAIKQEKPAKADETEETNKPQKELKESSEQVHEESQEISSGRGRNKPVLEEQRLGRKGRRKAVVPATELATAKSECESKTRLVEPEQTAEVPNIEEANDKKATTHMGSSPNKTGKRGKQHQKEDVKKLSMEKVTNEGDVSLKSNETVAEQSEKETSTKQIARRGRQRKVDDTKEKNTESTEETATTSHTTRRGGRSKKETAAAALVPKGRSTNRNRRTPVEHITGDSEAEQVSVSSKSANEMLDERPTTPNKIALPDVVEETNSKSNVIALEVSVNEDKNSIRETAAPGDAEDRKEEVKSLKKSVKRTHSPADSNQEANEKSIKLPKHEVPVVEKPDEMNIDSDLAKLSLEQKTDNQSVPSQVEKEKEVEKDVAAMKPQKPTRRKAAAKHEQHDKHNEEQTTKPRRKKLTEDVTEPKNEDVKLTEVNPEPEEQSDEQMPPQEEGQEVKSKKVRIEAIAGENNSEEQEEPLLATRRRAVARHIEHNHDESSAAIKRRAGRTKQTTEDPETEGQHLNLKEANKIEQVPQHLAEEDAKQTKSGETSSSRRNVGKNKVENKDSQLTEQQNKTDDEPTEDIEKHFSHDEKPDAHIVTGENHQPQEEAKRGRGRKKKNDHKQESKEPATSHSPATKSRGRKRKEINTDIGDHVAQEKEQPYENIEHQPPETPARPAPTTKSSLKVIQHITAESQEPEDTPSKRARNVPQRKAATAYHNYDETSDSETTSKTKKKTDTPRKSLEATKKAPIAATITSASVVSESHSPSSATPITTARGRTRKPTAKVQQYLEEERAKAETPKKRALFAIAAANADTTTPQPTPGRRGRKPSTAEIEVEGTPQTGKGRGGKAKVAVLQVHKEESSDLSAAATTASVEEKNVELQATAIAQTTTKARVGGRKAKITGEEPPSTDEPPAKKSPIELENEKQELSPSSAHPTPTRTAGKRNAAAAAKARIEEDALAAAAIEPPKRARTKKVATKVSTQITSTDTDNRSNTIEAAAEEHSTKTDETEVKNKNDASKKMEHRLESAATVEVVEDAQADAEVETKDKPSNKRGRKPATAATTDSPAVPAKRGRKPKIVEKAADPKTPVIDSKTSRGRGRGRKNVHFDEHEVDASSSQQNETDVEAAPAETSSEPVKRGTRTRRK